MTLADDDVRRVLREHLQRLMQLPNVVGTGIRDDVDRGLVIAVYVRAKLAESQLAASDLVPATLEATVDGSRIEVPTRVIESGEIRHS